MPAVDLTDYGLNNRPRVEKRRRLELGARSVGYIGRNLETGRPCYISARDTTDHCYHGEDPWYDLPFDGDGYGLSVALFERLHAAGVEAVYIPETDTGRVYHFSFQQFVDGAPINFEDEAADRGFAKDPQMVVAVADAIDVWDDHYPGIFAKQAAYR
jgi:hypothetical protein